MSSIGRFGMLGSVKRPVIWFVLCGLVVTCLVCVAEDAAAVERPTEPGPYSAGYFDGTLNVTVGGNTVMVDCRYYYPATSGGEGTDPDPTGAPYPPIIYHIYTYGSVQPHLNRTNDRERIEFVVSHGFIVVTFTPFEPVATPGRSYYNDLVYHTDTYDANVSSPLHNMVKKDAYGALGEFYGGSLSFVHALTTERIMAVQSLGPYFGINYSEELHGPATRRWNNRDGAWMVQKGSDYTTYNGNLIGNYEHVEPDKIMVTVPGRWQRGSYRLDLVVAFFLYFLGEIDEYETYLYGTEAKNEVYTGQYGMEYDRIGGDNFTFKPVFTIDVPALVNMDEEVVLRVTCDSHVLLDHPTLLHEWYLGDWEVPYITSTTDQNISINFTEPIEYEYVRYNYMIGNITIKSNTGTMVVRNVWPVADAGPPNQTIDQDDKFELDGSGSYDTPSDIDTLEYRWTFDGKQSNWSTEPTYEVDTSRIRDFTAYLDVRDRHGKQRGDNITIEIINKPPEAIIVRANTTSDEDEVVELTGLGIDSLSHADTLMFRWDFGDGTTTQWSSSPGMNHTYNLQDTYTVTLHVKDVKGASNSTKMSITVSNVDPIAGIDLPKDGDKAVIDSKLEFNGWGSDTASDNGSLWYTWDFGDGRTAGGAEASHTYKEAGDYTVTLTVEDDDGATEVVTHTLMIEAAGPVLDGPVAYSVAIGFVVILGLAVVAATEPGKYWFGLLSVPFFTKTKDVLDNKTRYALHGVIVEKPGIHYSALREEFGLANGAAAYHLDVLQRRKFIRSARDGKLKGFYSAQEKLPEDVGMSPEGTRDAIEELVRQQPGIKQLEVMEELGLDRNAASYYLRELVKEGRLTSRKKGWYTVYTVNGRK